MTIESLLPPASTALERAFENAVARRIDALAIPVDTLWNPSKIAAPLLPWLAWGLSIDRWDPNWTEAQKRAACQNAIAEQRKKGTPASIKSVLASYDPLLRLVEWFETRPRGIPHTFEIRLPLYDGRTPAARAQLVEDVIRDIEMVKPVRSHFRFVQLAELLQRCRPVAAVRPVIFARFEAQAYPGSPMPGSGRRLLEDGSFLLNEDGTRRMLEAA